jgi:amidase
MLRLTQLFDITGHPALTLPCGAAGGLPVGLQLVGRQRAASALFHTALTVERALAVG